jgi:hypothetical protein
MARKDVKALLKAARSRRKVLITLCSGESFPMFFMPLTEAENETILESVQDDNRNNAYAIRVLIRKAEYEDGMKMFDDSDFGMIRQEFTRGDINRMVTHLLDNGGELAAVSSKSNQESDKE